MPCALPALMTFVPLRIGVLTFHCFVNYGAMMQAYGLVSYLTNAGHKVEVIDYWFPHARRSLQHDLGRSRWRPVAMARDVQKICKFWAFTRRSFPLTAKKYDERSDLRELSDRYDLIVAGSDQIWNTALFGYLPDYFLRFADPARVRMAAYAPSAGATIDWGHNTSEIGGLLRRFHHLSVRDLPTAELVRQASGRSAVHVLDPTFLGDLPRAFPDRGSPETAPYALGYFVERKKEIHQAFDTVKRRLGLKLVVVGDRSPAADIQRVAVSPGRFMDYFRHATIVLTNSFHGCILSILCRRPFVIPYHSPGMTRQRDLLERLGLGDRVRDVVTDPSALGDDCLDLDYEAVYRRLEEPRALSHHFLDGVLRDAQAWRASRA